MTLKARYPMATPPIPIIVPKSTKVMAIFAYEDTGKRLVEIASVESRTS